MAEEEFAGNETVAINVTSLRGWADQLADLPTLARPHIDLEDGPLGIGRDERLEMAVHLRNETYRLSVDTWNFLRFLDQEFTRFAEATRQIADLYAETDAYLAATQNDILVRLGDVETPNLSEGEG